MWSHKLLVLLFVNPSLHFSETVESWSRRVEEIAHSRSAFNIDVLLPLAYGYGADHLDRYVP